MTTTAVESSRSIVAYLGPPASYTHQVAVDSFDVSNFLLEPQVSIRDVFAAVQQGSAAFGVVPFENCSNGSVLYTLDLLIDKEEDFLDIQVSAEAYLGVQHCLLGRAYNSTANGSKGSQSSGSATPTASIPFPREPRSKPVTDIGHIKRIYSHPQAFGQSEAFLSTYLKLAKRHEVSSTSEAAKLAAQDESGEAAAIASSLAADVNGLTILAQGIQDVEDNVTRFLVIQKGPVNPDDQGLLPKKLWSGPVSHSHRKALVSFSINHETQGALANALLIFKKHALNLTSINSRPSRIRPWHYMFLVEFKGQDELRNPDLLHQALRELDTTTEVNKWLGCWTDRFGQ